MQNKVVNKPNVCVCVCCVPIFTPFNELLLYIIYNIMYCMDGRRLNATSKPPKYMNTMLYTNFIGKRNLYALVELVCAFLFIAFFVSFSTLFHCCCCCCCCCWCCMWTVHGLTISFSIFVYFNFWFPSSQLNHIHFSPLLLPRPLSSTHIHTFMCIINGGIRIISGWFCEIDVDNLYIA